MHWAGIITYVVESVTQVVFAVANTNISLLGGLYEAILDYRIMKSIKRSYDYDRWISKLLVIVGDSARPRACNTSVGLEAKLPQIKNTKSHLRNLLETKYRFWLFLGVPIIFFLGAYVNTILGFKNKSVLRKRKLLLYTLASDAY